jgi:hypothetical protein
VATGETLAAALALGSLLTADERSRREDRTRKKKKKRRLDLFIEGS